MQSRSFGLAIFWLGVLSLHLYSSILYLWNLTGIPMSYPFFNMSFFPWAPPLGAILMIGGGLIYGLFSNKEDTK